MTPSQRTAALKAVSQSIISLRKRIEDERNDDRRERLEAEHEELIGARQALEEDAA